MADPKLVERLKQGVELWNCWRNEQQLDSLQIDLIDADLSKTNLHEINLNHADLVDADLSETNLREARLRAAYMRGANLSHTDLSHADLGHAYMSMANLSKADLINADLSQANLNYTDLNCSNLSKANLIGATLVDTDLSGANLNGADLRAASLYKADLRVADLHSTDLSHSHLNSANLHRADLSGANLNGANLRDANLSAADLSGANLNGANLRDANLSATNLLGANLSSANLRGAVLRDAIIGNTVFANMDLCDIKGLIELNHLGPSHIALGTILLPPDGSALHFLRGTGVTDEWINLYRATMMHPIQYYSCFISYSSKDEMFARHLHVYLQDKGVRCWFAPHDMKIGDKIRSRIDEAIHLQDKLLLILSEDSVTSDWVEHEVETALARERREKRTILFPIRLDEAILEREYTGWAALVQHERHIGDFTNWTDPQAYNQAFELLLRDLKAQG